MNKRRWPGVLLSKTERNYMKEKICLLRHGESAWNKENRRFTGWTDVDLTRGGVAEGCKGAETSCWQKDSASRRRILLSKRAVKTWIVAGPPQHQDFIPVEMEEMNENTKASYKGT